MELVFTVLRSLSTPLFSTGLAWLALAASSTGQQWQELGTFTASGLLYVGQTATTSSGVKVNFDLSADPQCTCDLMYTTTCGESTVCLVEYCDTPGQGGAVDSIRLRFSIKTGPDGSYWKNVTVDNFVPTFVGQDAGHCSGAWGADGAGGLIGVGEFEFVAAALAPKYYQADPCGTAALGGACTGVTASGSLSASSAAAVLSLEVQAVAALPADPAWMFVTEDVDQPSLYLQDLGTWWLGAQFYSLGGLLLDAGGQGTFSASIPSANPAWIGRQLRFQGAVGQTAAVPGLVLTDAVGVLVGC